MSPLGLLFVGVVLAVPIGWLISEFRAKEPLRIALGVSAIAATTFFVSSLVCFFTHMNYNQEFGYATKDLIETSLNQIDVGHLDRVLKVWRGLNQQYDPTYENHHPAYSDLVTEATARMRGEIPIAPNSRWDVPVFSRGTWVGHWENETGYWIVINDVGREVDIRRSGDRLARMESVSLSNDFRVLKFEEDGHWLHTLTLKNKYEATHEWFDLEKKAVWRTEPMNKLRKATEEEKQMTQQITP
jgi:hypothetical protein